MPLTIMNLLKVFRIDHKMSANDDQTRTQQIHYLINYNKTGSLHWEGIDLISP